jgi:hypothetical protein
VRDTRELFPDTLVYVRKMFLQHNRLDDDAARELCGYIDNLSSIAYASGQQACLLQVQKSKILNLEPETRNPKPETRNPKPFVLDPWTPSVTLQSPNPMRDPPEPKPYA